jgi:regulator of RNase E activity RraA
MAAQDLFDTLRKFDTPTICNALEVIDPAARLSGFTRKPLVSPFPNQGSFIGFARTATIRATHPNELSGEAARQQRLDYYEYIASGGPSPGLVVIQDLDGPDTGFGCFWGEVQSNVHKGLGCVGVVTDGGIRDIPDWADGFSALAGSIVPSHAHVHLAGFGQTVRVAGMVVKSGDIVHADQHGAVVIPEAVIDKIPAAVDLLQRKEAVILDMAKAPGFTFEMLREALQKQDEIH